MELCCGSCHVELKNNDLVVLDDFGSIKHEQCYDFTNYQHLVDTVGPFESVKGKFPEFLLSTYKELIALDENEQRSPEEIEDEEVIAVLANMFNG